jgi:hypothetical protein
VRDAHHRLQLIGEQARANQCQPDAADAKERVGLRGHREVVQGLVTTDVEGAHGDSPPAEVLCNSAVGGFLLVDIGGLGTTEEKELRADQASEVGTEVGRSSRVLDSADVGADEDRDAVAGGGGRGRVCKSVARSLGLLSGADA